MQCLEGGPTQGLQGLRKGFQIGLIGEKGPEARTHTTLRDTCARTCLAGSSLCLANGTSESHVMELQQDLQDGKTNFIIKKMQVLVTSKLVTQTHILVTSKLVTQTGNIQDGLPLTF